MRLVHHPVLLNYYVTFRCNAKCAFCDIWEKPSPYVTLEAARRNLRDARRLGVRVADFTGGEPLLHRELADLLRAARAEGMLTTVTTNAML
ncbi:MAG: radical SAM protein, partial [Hymenobacteraceae bacterium]|nr:radical SAM protein [Hymenobacteraceae bacterium]